MRDTLEPDEFRPIIASSLIFSKILRRRVVRQTLLTFVGLVVAAIVLALLMPTILSLGIQFLPLAIVPFSILYARRLRSLADKKACDLVSPSSFLVTLNKVAYTINQVGYQQPRALSGPRGGGPVPMLPNVQTRIARIQRNSQLKGQ